MLTRPCRIRRVLSGRLVANVALLSLLAPFSLPSNAADWRLSKGIEAGVSASDNADGASSTERARGETALTLFPFVTLSGTGRRHELIVDAGLELTRLVDADRTSVDPEASVRTRSVLVERFAELETVARVSQRGVDASPLSDGASSSFDERREETWEIGISPSLESTLGDRARLRGDYRFTAIRSSDDTQIGSDTHAVASRLDTVLDRRGTFAFLLTDGARVEFENETSGRAASIGAGFGRPFGSTLLGEVSVGRDWARAGGESDTLVDTFWEVAFRWEPNERLIATLGYGERVFGRRPSASLGLNGRRSSVELRWFREFLLSRNTIRGDASSLSFGADVPDVPLTESGTGVVDDEEPLSPFARDASSVREQIDVAYTLTGRRSRLALTAGWFDDETLGEDETAIEPAGTGIRGTRRGHELSLGVERTLSTRIDVSSRYRFLSTRSDDTTGRVRENIVELVVRMRL